jgi:hypothetical protein
MHYQKTKPDSLALRWLLHIRKFHELDSLEHPSFVQLTVHCLVADGSLDALEQWILCTDAIQRSTPANRNAPLWSGRISKYAIQSQSYWTEASLILEDSVNTFVTVARQDKERRLGRQHFLLRYTPNPARRDDSCASHSRTAFC